MKLNEVRAPEDFRRTDTYRDLGFTLEEYLGFNEVISNNPALVDSNVINFPYGCRAIISRLVNSSKNRGRYIIQKKLDKLKSEIFYILEKSVSQTDILLDCISNGHITTHDRILGEMIRGKNKRFEETANLFRSLETKLKPHISPDEHTKFRELVNCLNDGYLKSLDQLEKPRCSKFEEDILLSRDLAKRIYSVQDFTYRARSREIKSPGKRDLGLVLFGCLQGSPFIISHDQDIPQALRVLKSELKNKGLHIPRLCIPYRVFSSGGRDAYLPYSYIEVEIND